MSAALLIAAGLRLLVARVADLEHRVTAGEESAWPPYLDALRTLAALDRPERGAMLTTREMAERLGLAPKTLLKHAKTGAIRPEVRRGKLVRWRGTEALR